MNVHAQAEEHNYQDDPCTNQEYPRGVGHEHKNSWQIRIYLTLELLGEELHQNQNNAMGEKQISHRSIRGIRTKILPIQLAYLPNHNPIEQDRDSQDAAHVFPDLVP